MVEITVSKFTKRFGAKTVHRGVSFELEKGQCMGLIGGSGSGKSVLLRSLIGLEHPDSGDVIVKGQNVRELDEKGMIELRKKVAYVFQGGALFDSMSVYDNLAYPLREHTTRSESEIAINIRAVLESFGLSGNESLFPADLSGGMQKRLGLARAIILKPDIVLYDEPTAGLDPFNTRKIQEMILSLKKQGVTSILVTHDMPSAFAVCDRIALLVEGTIQAHSNCANGTSTDEFIQRFAQGEDLAAIKETMGAERL